MKKKLFFILSLFAVCNKIIFSESQSGLILFTNFNYFKSNERNYTSGSNINSTSIYSENNSNNSTLPPINKPNIDQPNIVPPTVIPTPSVPPVKPVSPTTPGDQNSYSDIFFQNNWILNTHSYTTAENLTVSSSNNLFTGMGSVASGFSVENSKNVLVENGNSTQDLLGMLSKNGGEIINSSTGTITVQGTGTNFAMAVIGDGKATNFGNINVNNSQVGGYIDGSGTFNNSGNITVSSNSTGIFAVNGGSIKNLGSIDVLNNSIGIVTEEASFGSNESTINVSGSSIGMYASNGGDITNNGSINVSGNSSSNSFAMYLDDNGAIFNNGSINLTSGGVGVVLNNSDSNSYFFNDTNGKISGNGLYGVNLKGQGYTQNFGTIDISNGIAAILIDGTGSAYNYNNITLKNTKYGLLSQNGGTVTNDTDGTITGDGTEIAKIAVSGSGSGINNGTLASTNSPYTMYLSGNGTLTNNGTLTSNITDNFSTHFIMYGTGGGNITNEKNGVINVNGGDSNYAMGIDKSGSLMNNGTINVGNYQNGILLVGPTTGTNNGTINFSIGSSGVNLYDSTSETYFSNYGTINGTSENYQGGTYGIYAFGSGNIENMGVIKIDSGTSGITMSGNGNATNYEQGLIDITNTDYGMYANNGGTITNLGTIKVTNTSEVNLNPSGGMFINSNGNAINNGKIIVSGSNVNAMGSAGVVSVTNESSGSIAIENGSINSYAFYLNGGSGINHGTIDLGTTGLLTTNGTVFNYGNIIAPNGVTNGTNGTLVMETGGTTSTPLKEVTLGLSYATPLYTENDKSFTSIVPSFSAETINSYSHLYEISTTSEDVFIRRKDFNEISDPDLGSFLETIYVDSKNYSKDRFFNILRSARNDFEYNYYLDSFFGRNIYPNIIFQTKETITYTTDNIVENLENKLPKERKSSLIVGYTFENFRQKGFDRVEGHKDYLNGFYLGKQLYLNEISDYGFIFSYTRLDSDYYSSAGKREDNFLQGTAFINYNNNNEKGIGSLFFGYSTGNIKRDLNLTYLDFSKNNPTYNTINENYKGDLKNFYLGTSGKFSKRYNFNKFFLEPEVSAYLMGIFQNKISESGGEYELHIDNLNSFFSKVNTDLSIGKIFYPKENYILTFKLLAGLGQEINSSDNDLDVSLKNIANEKATIKVDRKNNFSQELGAKINIENIGVDSLSFYIDYKYIFEDDNSWKIGTGLNYRF